MRFRTMLAEDNRILRDGVKDLINEQSDLIVVSATGGGHDTVRWPRPLSLMSSSQGLRTAQELV
jgi:hypothetical protein